MKSETTGESTLRAEVLNISKHGFWLLIGDAEYFLSFNDFPWFKNAPVASVLHVELLNADHLYWPNLDVDLDVQSIKAPDRYPLVYKSTTASG
ncbi:MAG: DUF2442 domain-containing protein [Nitrospirota bacterium]